MIPPHPRPLIPHVHQILHDPVLDPPRLGSIVEQLEGPAQFDAVVVFWFAGPEGVADAVARGVAGGDGVLDCAQQGFVGVAVGEDDFGGGGAGGGEGEFGVHGSVAFCVILVVAGDVGGCALESRAVGGELKVGQVTARAVERHGTAKDRTLSQSALHLSLSLFNAYSQ